MPEGLTEMAKTAGAIGGGGILGAMLAWIRLEGSFVRKSDLADILQGIQQDLKEIKETQSKFFDDFYKPRYDR